MRDVFAEAPLKKSRKLIAGILSTVVRHPETPMGQRRHRAWPADIALGVFIMVEGLTGCAGSQPAPTPGVQPGNVEIAIIARDWHTEIGLLTSQVTGPLATVDPTTSGARYLLVGFGDRSYFADHDAGFGTAVAALFPGPSAVQLTTVGELPEDENHTIVRLHLSRDAVDRILGFVWNSLDRTDGRSLSRVAEYGDQNVFYAGRQTYDSFYNCNTWTADALREAGLPFNPSGVLFASEVMEQARKIASAQASAPSVKMTGQ